MHEDASRLAIPIVLFDFRKDSSESDFVIHVMAKALHRSEINGGRSPSLVNFIQRLGYAPQFFNLIKKRMRYLRGRQQTCDFHPLL